MATLRAFDECQGQMDFIKRFLGISPDHTDRLLEVLLLVALVAMIAVLARRFFHHLRD